MSQTLSFSIQQHQLYQLRFLCPNDIPEIKGLCGEWFPIDYPDSWFEDITSSPRFYSLAATFNKHIIGMIVSEVKPRSMCNREDADILASTFSPHNQVAYILSLGVVQNFRRNGIASLLLDNLLSYLVSTEHKQCKAVYLHVLTTNNTAIHFYEKQHFKLHNFLPFYYSIEGSPRDCYCYVLYINGGYPPCTITETLQQLGDYMSGLKVCSLPPRLITTLHSLWLYITNGSHRTVNRIRYS